MKARLGATDVASVYPISKLTAPVFVKVPDIATVSLDGVAQVVGPVQLNMTFGRHSISVPGIIQVDNSTRLRFASWKWIGSQTPIGFDALTVTVYVRLGMTLKITAVYTTQYRLVLLAQYGEPIGQGWYDEGSSANISLTSEAVSMSGMLGTLAAKWSFKGWFEGASLVTASINSTIAMDRPRTLAARWEPDYTTTVTILAVPALATTAVATVHLSRRKRTPAKSKRVFSKQSHVEYLARLEELHSSGRISARIYSDMKDEYLRK